MSKVSGYASMIRSMIEMNGRIKHRPASGPSKSYDNFSDLLEDLKKTSGPIAVLWNFSKDWPANDREQVDSMGFSLPFYEVLIVGLEVTEDNIFERWTYDHLQKAKDHLNQLKQLGCKVEWTADCPWALRSPKESPCALTGCFCPVNYWYIWRN